jgi:thioredoxin-like negative regulator of GroEL
MARVLRIDYLQHARFGFLLFAILMSIAVTAAERPFDREAFEAAQRSGKPVLLSVHADWCTTCRAQEPLVAALLGQPKFSSFASFRVDFDKQKDVLRQFRVQHQSTLIVFKDGKEVSRSIALTDPAGIEQQLRKAL